VTEKLVLADKLGADVLLGVRLTEGETETLEVAVLEGEKDTDGKGETETLEVAVLEGEKDTDGEGEAEQVEETHEYPVPY